MFNLGEGALRQRKNSKLEFYRIALGSVGECFAILTVLFPVHPNRKLIEHGQALCNHIAALITNLIASVEAKYD